MAKKNTHLVNLSSRQVKVTNLNYSPEKEGDHNVPRVDLSLEMVAKDEDVDELVRVRNGSNVLKALWDKNGDTVLLDAEPIALDIEYRGKAELRFVNGADPNERFTFDPCRLKRVRVKPTNGHAAEVKFQIRVDPGDDLAALADMRTDEQCMFMFTGSGDDAPDSGKQDKLDV